jgi:hypothetical protein
MGCLVLQVLPELQDPKVDERPILKAGALQHRHKAAVAVPVHCAAFFLKFP